MKLSSRHGRKVYRPTNGCTRAARAALACRLASSTWPWQPVSRSVTSTDILYERLPVWQETYDFGVRDPAAVLYPAYDADHKPAGPNGIRRESPHLLIVLEGLDICQVCFPAVRPVPPSHIYQPAQPLSCSYSLLLF